MGERTNIVISASHNISDEPQEALDQLVIKQDKEYAAQGKMRSSKFKRSRPAKVDENKFAMALGSNTNLTSVAMLALRLALEPNTNIAVVGGGAVETHTALVMDFLAANYGIKNITFVPEGTHPMIGNNMRNGKAALGNPRKFAFISGDIPYIDLGSLLAQYSGFDPGKHDLWADLNSKTNIFPNDTLFDRNYYHEFITADGTMHPCKEPNIYFFGNEFNEWKLVNNIYHHREMGGGNMSAVARIIWRRLPMGITRHDNSALDTFFSVAGDIIPIIRHLKRTKKVKSSLSTVEKIGRLAMGRRVKFTAEHNDPFRLKDIDAFHDLAYYMCLYDHLAESGGFASIYDTRTAQALGEFDTFIGERRTSLADSLYLAFNIGKYIAQRDKELQMNEYRDDQGYFKLQPRPDERIPASVEFLQRRKN